MKQMNDISLSSCKQKIEWLTEINNELLEACKAINKFCVFVDSNLKPGQGEGFRDAWHMVHHAILKAEGKDI